MDSFKKNILNCLETKYVPHKGLKSLAENIARSLKFDEEETYKDYWEYTYAYIGHDRGRRAYYVWESIDVKYLMNLLGDYYFNSEILAKARDALLHEFIEII